MKFFFNSSILLLCIVFVKCEFTNDFRAFIHNKYGIGIVNQLERRELGSDACQGGRIEGQEDSKDERTGLKREAVIIIHGITNKITRFNVGSF